MLKNGARNQQYLEGFNDTGSTIAKFLAVAGCYSSIVLPAAVSSPIYGITTDAIADQAYGDIQYAGVAIGTAGEAWTLSDIEAGLRLYAGTDGKLYKFDATAGVNQAVCGLPMTASSGDGDTVEVLLQSGGIGQGA